jgi:hypothetical protein
VSDAAASRADAGGDEEAAADCGFDRTAGLMPPGAGGISPGRVTGDDAAPGVAAVESGGGAVGGSLR